MIRFLPAIISLCLLASCAAQKPWYNKEVKANWTAQSPAENTEPVYTVYLAGDAGAAETDRTEPALKLLGESIQEGGTQSAVLFMGDNIYSHGLPDSTAPEYPECKRRITEQLKVVEDYPGGIVFIPGNHDWDSAGEKGLKKVNNQERLVEAYLARGNTFIPDNGCPGPVEIPLNENITLLVIDTQWWLHKYEKPGRKEGCKSDTEADFLENLAAVLEANKGKQIIVSAHHPMYSYGNHGGRYRFVNHLFPLTMAKPHLYVPLPVLGTMAVLFRKFRGMRQDIPHPVYRKMKKGMTALFEEVPGLIYACGHEHTLQYIRKGKSEESQQHYIVSGGGCKTSYVSSGKDGQFTQSSEGFARLRFYENGETWLDFWNPVGDGEHGNVVYREKIR